MKSLFTLCILLLSTFVCRWLYASEYVMQSNYSISGRYNDNHRLVVNPKSDRDELVGADFAAGWGFSRNTGQSNFQAGLNLDAGSYNQNGFNTFDQRTNVNYSQFTERSRWNVGIGYNHDSARVTEQTTSGSGVFEESSRRVNLTTLNMGWSTRLSERNRLNWSAFSRASRNESSRLIDTDSANSSFLWQYTVNERIRLQSQLGYSILKTDDDVVVLSPLLFDINSFGLEGVQELVGLCQLIGVDQSIMLAATLGGAVLECGKNSFIENTQKTFSTQVGIYFVFTERLILDLLVGKTFIDSESDQSFSDINPAIATDPDIQNTLINNSNDSVRYTLDLTYEAERLKYRLSVSSVETATSNGFFSLNKRAGFDINWQISEHGNVDIESLWFEQETSNGDVDVFSGRTQISLRTRYRYRLNESWSVSGEYRYLDQSRRALKDTDSNEIFFGISWVPVASKWSR